MKRTNRNVVALAASCLFALLACGGGLSPFNDLPTVEQNMFDACEDEAMEGCYAEKGGYPPPVGGEGVAAAKEDLEGAKKREAAVKNHFDECYDETRQTYFDKGTPDARKAWLKEVGCSDSNIQKGADKPAEE